MQVHSDSEKRHSKSSQAMNGSVMMASLLPLQTKTQFKYSDKLTLRPLEPSLVRLVPKPSSAYVKNGLPKWNTTSLDLKIPIIPGPDGNIVLSRGKLGKKLWSKSLDNFILHDPHCQEVSLEYNPVHDLHLRHWFRCPRNQEVLLKLGIISSDLDAQCNIKEYNDYRKYLRRLHCEAINKQITQKEKEEIDKKAYVKAKNNLEKENDRMLKLESTAIIRNENKHRIESEKTAIEDDCKRRLLRVDERIANVEKCKQEIKQSLADRTKALNNRIQTRVKRAQILERENKIKTLKKWHDEGVAKKTRDEENERKRKENLLCKAKKRWDDKLKNQQLQITSEEFLHKQIALRKKHFIKKYNAKMKYLHNTIEEHLILRKSKKVLDHSVKRHADKTKQVILSVSNAWAGKGECTVENARKFIMERLAQIPLDFEPYILISEAKQLLESRRRRHHVPTEVQLVIKWLLESAIATYTAEKFKKTIISMSQKILLSVQNIKEPSSQMRKVGSIDDSYKSARFTKIVDKKQGFGSMEIGKANIMEIESIIKKTLNFSDDSGVSDRPQQPSGIKHFIVSSEYLKPLLKPSEPNAMSKKLSSKVLSFGNNARVSFGEISAVLIPFDGDDMKSIKTRIPTPIPSITTLTTAIFDQSDTDLTKSEFKTVFVEQQKLLESIQQVSKNADKMIDKRLEKLMNRNYKFQRDSKYKNKKSEMPGPLIRLCSAVLFKPIDEDLPSIVDAVILSVLKDINMSPANLKHLQKKF